MRDEAPGAPPVPELETLRLALDVLRLTSRDGDAWGTAVERLVAAGDRAAARLKDPALGADDRARLAALIEEAGGATGPYLRRGDRAEAPTRAPAPPLRRASLPPPPPRSPPPPPGPLVLVVEVDHDARLALADALRAEGYAARSVPTGEEALQALGELPLPEVVVLNPRLPRMTGEEFLCVKGQYFRWARIPVVTLPSEAHEGEEVLAAALAVVRRLCPLGPRASDPP